MSIAIIRTAGIGAGHASVSQGREAEITRPYRNIERTKTMIDNKTAPYGILALRVTTGALFLFHGLVKLFVFTPAGTAGYFESIGLPGALGYLTMLIEIAGGVALILGIKTRLVSAALVPVLLGAAYFGHGGAGFNWSNPNGGWEYPVMWAIVQGALAALGDGAHALLPARKATGAASFA